MTPKTKAFIAALQRHASPSRFCFLPCKLSKLRLGLNHVASHTPQRFFYAEIRCRPRPPSVLHLSIVTSCGVCRARHAYDPQKIRAIHRANSQTLWQEALHALATGEADDAATSAAIGAAGKGGRWDIALALLEGRKVTLRLCGAAISACAAARRWQAALSLLHEMPSKSLEPDAACFGAGSCERVGHHELSSKLLAEMSAVAAIDDKTLRIGFTNAMSEANRANYWERALQLFGQVCDMQSDGLSLDTAALGAALAACQTGAAWHQSLAILEMTEAAEVWSSTPGSLVVAYSAAIGACVHGGRWALALQLLGRCKHETAYVAEVQPALLVAGHTTLSSLAATLRWEKALELFSQMAEEVVEGPGRWTLERATNIAAAACGRSNAWTKACALLDMRLVGGEAAASRSIGHAIVAAACERGAAMQSLPWQMRAAALHWTSALSNGWRVKLFADTAPVVAFLQTSGALSGPCRRFVRSLSTVLHCLRAPKGRNLGLAGIADLGLVSARIVDQRCEQISLCDDIVKLDIHRAIRLWDLVHLPRLIQTYSRLKHLKAS
eukprot:s3317_g8.t3